MPNPSLVASAPDLTHDLERAHNPAAQHDVIAIDKAALGRNIEHYPAHIYHDANAEESRETEVVYSKGNTIEPRVIPHQNPRDHDMHHRKQAEATDSTIPSGLNPENGSTSIALGSIQSEEDPRTHTASNIYRRYRVFFHVILWLFFTA